jgi:hypothetical protein
MTRGGGRISSPSSGRVDSGPSPAYHRPVTGLARLLCLLSALAVIEAPHWLAQAYAWGTMVRERTPAMGLEAAVADTLSGDHPCPKCLALQREREKKHERAPVEDSRLCLLIPPGTAADPAAFLPVRLATLPAAPSVGQGPSRWEDVPTPPPRVG